jgi:hypothetical protein
MMRATVVLGLAAMAVAAPAQAFHLEDSLKGATQGNPVGGSIGPDGWTVTDRTDRLWYALPTMSSGSIEFKVANITYANLPLDDHEIFALYEAGFGIAEPINYNPEYRENFYKSMIRIYGQAVPDRLGQQKLMWGICNAGAPGFGECPCASSSFSEPFGGDPNWDGSEQTLRVEWSDGHARYLRNGGVVHDIEYASSGSTYAPSGPHFSLGSARATSVDSAGMPVGALFYDVVVDGVEGPAITSCPGGGTGGSAAQSGSGGSTTQTATFAPVADTWSEPVAPTATHGSDLELRTGSDGRTIFLRFDVQGVTGNVTSAKIVLMATNSGGGGDAHVVLDDTWSETTLSHSNKPMPEAAILSSVPLASVGSAFEFDVTSAMIQNGLASFAITSTVVDGCAYASRESTTPPELVLEFSPGTSVGATTGSGGRPNAAGVTGVGGGGRVADDWVETADDGNCACRLNGAPSNESFWGWLGLVALCAGLCRKSRNEE